MKNSNVARIAILLIGLFATTPFTFGQMERPCFDRCANHECIISKLELSDEQQEALEQLRLDHQSAMIDLRADVEKKKLEKEELKSKGNYSRNEFIAKVQSLSDAKQKIAIMKANHRMDIYELLKSDQKKIFDKIRKGFCDKRKQFRRKRFQRGF
ncbi:Spy/CpxP family protein refolding chaperone [Bacteroidota bacterium]